MTIYFTINKIINELIILLPFIIIYDQYPLSRPYIIFVYILFTMFIVSIYLNQNKYMVKENFDTDYHPYLGMPTYGGSTELHSDFSYLNDNIAFGNPQSWSDRTNPYIDMNIRGPQDAITYQGTPMPLSYEDNPTTPIPMKDSMYKFSNYACRPECCLYSPFSCSNGCVCWEAPPEKFMGTENDAITPTS